MAIATRALVIVMMAVTIVTFGLNDGRKAYASEGEAEPSKPADTKPAPPPLPPRPTEYPRGLDERLKPGQAAATGEQAPAQKPGAEIQPTPSALAKIQPMPAPVAGAKSDEGTVPQPGNAAATTAHWVPPRRYHFVMDAYTGLAMGGNDPVAFFVDGMPRVGSSEHELDWGGTTWHFINDGNLAAFKTNPEVYAPKFGGRCAFGLSQGLLVEGQPQFFVVHRDRLYLFANAGYRAAFLTNPDAIAAEAEREWPILTRGEP